MSPSMNEELIDDVELDDELDIEEETVTQTTTTKRTRKTFSPDNTYVFADKEAASAARKDGSIVYKDGSAVEGLRVFTILQGEDDDQEELCYVASKNASYAAEAYLDSKNISAELTFKKKRGGGGRSKTKIESQHLEFGKVILSMIEGGSAPDAVKANFEKLYGSDGEYPHYRDSEGNWKEATH